MEPPHGRPLDGDGPVPLVGLLAPGLVATADGEDAGKGVGCIEVGAVLVVQVEPGQAVLRIGQRVDGGRGGMRPVSSWNRWLSRFCACLLVGIQDGSVREDRRAGLPEPRPQAAQRLGRVAGPGSLADPPAQYVPDLKLAWPLQGIVDSGVYVTLVLDRRHAGGTTRAASNDVAVRGVEFIDDTPRPPGDPAPRSATRNMSLSQRVLPEPRGYTLLAACRPQELA